MILVFVAPHVGAWIETSVDLNPNMTVYVAPHVGAWIETSAKTTTYTELYVAPHVGAWIETWHLRNVSSARAGRSPCGSVD